MAARSRTVAVLTATALLLGSMIVFLSERASAASWLETTDTDFGDGDFLIGTGFETQLHGTWTDAYIQNKQDLGKWVEKMPPSDPGDRRSFGFTNDSHKSRFILFGGIDGVSTARNDTWQYDSGANQWTRICADDSPACAPPRRAYPSMTYDNKSRVVVLFGGTAADMMTELTDTWEFHVMNNTWVNRTGGTRPRFLSYHSMVYDPVTNAAILVARGASGMEVWSYSTSTHAWQQKASALITARSGFALAYNYQENHQRVVLFGGSEVMQSFDDTWEYNAQTSMWSKAQVPANPPFRSGSSMTYVARDAVRSVVIWGGNISDNMTWKYRWEIVYTPDPVWKPVWSVLPTPSTAPSPLRRYSGLAYDPGHDAVVMFGGSDFSGRAQSDTWSLEFGYRLEGKYVSHFFNTFDTAALWDYIFWNQTPAAVPPDTIIRFQLDFSNICNESLSPNWGGVYTVPGSRIGVSGYKCVRYLLDMITNDSSVAPRLEDVTLVYLVTPHPPQVVSVSPSMSNNPVTAPIYINFSKPMNTANTWVSISPNVTLDIPWQWYESDSKVKITHSTFLTGQRYDVCVWAADKSGQLLDHPGNRYCWAFSTSAPTPYIEMTTPLEGTQNVNVGAIIVIDFSERMLTSSCWPYINITPYIKLDWGWDPTAKSLAGFHNSTPFQEMTTYTVDVPVGDPVRPCMSEYLILITYGPVAVPFSFRTGSVSPYIIETDPYDKRFDIAVNKTISAWFDRPMRKSSLAFYVNDIRRSMNWSGVVVPNWVNDTHLQLTHVAPLDGCTAYEVHIWALDTAGRSLKVSPDAPNPWRFVTQDTSMEGCPPYMLWTKPADGETEVAVDTLVSIGWYSPDGMDHSSVRFSVKDQYGGDFSRYMTPMWAGIPPGAILSLNHSSTPFNRCMNYTVTILAAKDGTGIDFMPGTTENPFHFSTVSTDCNPVLIWTHPANLAIDVPLDEPIKMKYSLPINTSNYNFLLRPVGAPPYSFIWSEGDTNVTITHALFTPGSVYNASAAGMGKNGNHIVFGPVPIVVKFTTVYVQGPNITATNPADGETDVPVLSDITIDFSEPMNTSTLDFVMLNFAGTFSYSWSNGDKTVTATLSNAFPDCTLLTAKVNMARNKTGWRIIKGPVPNPWSFTTECLPPQIISTSPSDGERDVPVNKPIRVDFNEPVNKTSFVLTLAPSDGIVFTQTWLNDRTVVVYHTKPFRSCTEYSPHVAALDMSGLALTSGPVRNPWNFTTECRFQIRNLQVLRLPPDGVLLAWDANPNATRYRVYHSTDKFAPWPWTVIQDVGFNSAYISSHLSDMQNHFYVVTGYNLTTESDRSTMGVIWHPSVASNLGKGSAFWFSLPYRTTYKRASDIARELGPGKINVVAKWDERNQTSISYYFLNGRWRGADFAINTGDGLWLSVVSAFDWAINGTDAFSALAFEYNPATRTHFRWFGLPHTGSIATARELVIAIEGGTGPGTNTKIVRVGKWDYAKQMSEIFYCGLSGWVGRNFNIGIGDGLWFDVTSSFVWTPSLIIPDVP